MDRHQSLAVFIVLALGATGCIAGSGGRHPGRSDGTASASVPPIPYVASCDPDTCEQGRQCWARVDQACGDCRAPCGGDAIQCGCSDECNYTVCDHVCPTDSSCPDDKITYDFELPQADDALRAACLRYSQTLAACGLDVDPSDCQVIAQVERPELASVYDCMASQGCTTDPACALPAPTDLAATVCDSVSECSSCYSDGFSWLSSEAGWLRADVAQGVLSCLDIQDCQRRVDCVGIWAFDVSNEKVEL